MNEIGGYFELEVRKGSEFHKNAIRLNTGRNAFEYILRAKGYKKVYLPYYTCDVMLEPILKLKLKFEFYHIDQTFCPVFDFHRINHDEVFVYNNYFGICNKQVKEVSVECKNLVIDNSQAFYAQPILGVDTFYSPRKFFGVPDGAYLYTDILLKDNFELDLSHNRFEHLLGRMEQGAEEFYKVFKENDAALSGQPIKKMSVLTRRILQSIDYDLAAKNRIDNIHFLHDVLKDTNILAIDIPDHSVPMVYPYLIDSGLALKKKLLDRKVFVATYWPTVTNWFTKDSMESFFSRHLVPLPIDQRYGITEMKMLLKIIEN